MSKSKLVLDSEALGKMGLHSEAIWVVEYDIPSPIKNQHAKNPKDKYAKGFDKKTAVKIRQIRNKLAFQLKFKLMATKNLYSSWFIEKEQLEKAIAICEQIKQQVIRLGFPHIAEKIRIFPLLTNEEGFESFMDRKAEFMLEFLSEAQKQVDKGLKEGLMSDSILWRCKKASEIVETLKETLKTHTRYNEIVDTLAMLDDTIGQFEAKKQQKAMKLAKKSKKA